MSRFLLATWDGGGTIPPELGLTAELVDRGHEVVVLSDDTVAPYEAAWNTTTAANGAHVLTAVARDAAGHSTTAAAVNVTVLNDLAAPITLADGDVGWSSGVRRVVGASAGSCWV